MKTKHSLINQLLLPDINQDELAIATAISIAREKKMAYYLGIWDNQDHLNSVNGDDLTEYNLIVGKEVPKDKLSYTTGPILDAYKMLKKKAEKESRLSVKVLECIKGAKNPIWGKYVIEIMYK